MQYKLSIAGKDYKKLQQHLFPGDFKEAVAIALCGRFTSEKQTKLLVHEVICIPYEVCIRESDRLTWPTSYILQSIERANKYGFSILKIHSHPGGGRYFSDQDDRADGDLFPSLFGWIDDAPLHSSCIMLPSGEIFGRVFKENNTDSILDTISVIGDVIQVWNNNEEPIEMFDGFNIRNIQAFGEGTANHLRGMSITVVGCSGTGSIIIEQLVRLGIGKLLIIDPDMVEFKNLNRILNSTIEDAKNGLSKVEMTKRTINRIGLGTNVEIISKDIYTDISIIKAIAGSDVIFGGVDSIDARHLLNQISNFYLLPYFDVGVSLIADGKGGIDHIVGTSNYLQPGGSSLQSRGLFTGEELRSALAAKFDPEYYEERKKEKYLKNIQVDSPAVISVNMMASAMVVNEFLSKIHGFREEESGNFSIVRVDILNGYMQCDNDGEPDLYLSKFCGRGDNIKTPLNMVEFENINR